MYERLKRLYQEGRIDAVAIDRAVDLGWITEEQSRDITATGETPT